MKKSNIRIFLLVLIVLFSQVKLTRAQESITASRPAPDFQLQDIRQDVISLSSYKENQPVVLLFWKTTSAFCEKEIQLFNDMYAALAQDDIEALSIDVGELSDKVADFVKSFNLAYRVLLDKEARVAGAFRIGGYPTYVLIDRNGNIVFQDSYFPYNKYKELILK